MLRATLLAGLLGLSALATPAFAEPIAKVVALYGVSNASGRSLTVGADIEENDRITVPGTGNVQILFIDGTKLVIGPRSSLVIERFLMRGGGTAKTVAVDALRGTFRFITGRSAKSAYAIKTANATIGIRGTGFDFWVANGTGVALLEGLVRLCNENGKCVNLDPRCEVGLAKSDSTRKLRNFAAGAVLRSRLPYILDQSSLNRQFRLDTGSCERVLRQTAEGQGSGNNSKPQGNSPNPPPTCGANCPVP